MRREIGKTTKDLTPELAQWMSSLPSLPGDRNREGPKGRHRIEYLFSQLRDGKFHGPNWATVLVNGVLYRVNGGHSSLMLCECNGHFPKGLQVCIQEFACDTIIEAADLFNEFDTQVGARTKPEQTNANARIYAELDSISTKAVGDAVKGIGTALTLAHGVRVSHDDRLRLIHSNQDFIVWCNRFIVRRGMQRAGTVAAMYLMFKKNKDLAAQFWTMVVDESHPVNTHPTRKLAMFLRDCAADGNKKSKWSTKAFMVKAIHAWNAYRKNTTTSLHFQADSGVPALS